MAIQSAFPNISIILIDIYTLLLLVLIHLSSLRGLVYPVQSLALFPILVRQSMFPDISIVYKSHLYCLPPVSTEDAFWQIELSYTFICIVSFLGDTYGVPFIFLK